MPCPLLRRSGHFEFKEQEKKFRRKSGGWEIGPSRSCGLNPGLRKLYSRTVQDANRAASGFLK